MGAFKNEKNGTWYVQFRYTDWQGLRQQKLKRSFATKREAQEWERAFLTEKKADVTMPFKSILLKLKYCRISSISDCVIYRQKRLSLGKTRLENKQIQAESRFHMGI